MSEHQYVPAAGWWVQTWRKQYESKQANPRPNVSATVYYGAWEPVVMFRVAEDSDWFHAEPITIEDGYKMVTPALQESSLKHLSDEDALDVMWTYGYSLEYSANGVPEETPTRVVPKSD